MTVALIILAFAVGGAFGDMQAVQSEETPESPADVTVEYQVDDDDDDDSVTMAIDMEDGGVIDLEMARGDVVIDTWDGDEVLVIVEKRQGAEYTIPSPRPAAFKVTRHGKSVRIAAFDNLGHPLTDLDLSYRIVVPKDRAGRKNAGHYDLSRLSAVIFKALHREALNWLMR